MNIQIEFQKIGISITTAEFMLDRAISKEHKNNIQKAIEGKNLKVKEANELLQKIFSAIIINGDNGDAIINKELENKKINSEPPKGTIKENQGAAKEEVVYLCIIFVCMHSIFALPG